MLATCNICNGASCSRCNDGLVAIVVATPVAGMRIFTSHCSDVTCNANTGIEYVIDPEQTEPSVSPVPCLKCANEDTTWQLVVEGV